jgi:hypothetical protein
MTIVSVNILIIATQVQWYLAEHLPETARHGIFHQKYQVAWRMSTRQ